MSTAELKLTIQARVANVPDNAPEPMLQRLVELLDEMTRKKGADQSRVAQLSTGIAEDVELLRRLASEAV